MNHKPKSKSRKPQMSARDALIVPMADMTGKIEPGPRGKAAAEKSRDLALAPLAWTWQAAIVCLGLIAVFVAAYWPVLKELVATWEREPDYSHGYLVVPVACYMLFTRRAQAPAGLGRVAWLGLGLVCLAFAIRVAGSLWYIDAVQAWSIPLWIAGVIWFFGGWGLLRWSLPAVAFLAFAIPLPFRAERLLSGPLQAVAARFSCAILQTLGLPALREGNIVIVNNFHMEIVEACSGMRIFMSIVALAFAYSILVDRPWWTKACLWASVLPIALFSNATRIVMTGVLSQYVSGEAAHKFSHDIAGLAMIPFAALLMAGVVWYMGRLIVHVQSATPNEALWGGPIGQAS